MPPVEQHQNTMFRVLSYAVDIQTGARPLLREEAVIKSFLSSLEAPLFAIICYSS